jgi:hypothetical protein
MNAMTRARTIVASAALASLCLPMAAAPGDRYEADVEVRPLDIGKRGRDQLPARLDIDFPSLLSKAGANGQVDFDTISIAPAGDAGAEPIPFRWYDADIPDPFPEFIAKLNTTHGKITPRPARMAGHLYNTSGSGKKGYLAFIHTQQGRSAAKYKLSFDVIDTAAPSVGNGPRGWIGDGQIRCGPVGSSTTGTGHTRIALDDWNDDGLIDIVHGEEAGCVFVLPNSGTATEPRFTHRMLVNDADRKPIDVGTHAAPLVIDFDGDGVKDLLVGTYQNRIAWYKNAGYNRDRKLAYKGLVMSGDKPLELPITPVPGRQESIFNHDYYPVIEPVDFNGDGRLDLLAGGYVTGRIYLLENTGADKDGAMQLVVRDPIKFDGKPLNVGDWCAAPAVADLDGDGNLDLLSGLIVMTENSPGEGKFLRYWRGKSDGSKRGFTEADFPHTGKLPSNSLATPRMADLTNDGLLDLVVSAGQDIFFYPNVGSKTSPKFQVSPDAIQLAWQSDPLPVTQFLDYDGDGMTDLFSRYSVRLGSGGPSPFTFGKPQSVLAPGKTIEHRSGIGDDWSWPYLADLDGDGKLDVLFGDWNGYVWFHRNESSSAPKQFDLVGVKLTQTDGKPIKVGPVEKDPNANFAALQGARTVFAAKDVDGDGRRDLVVGDTFGIVRYYHNSGASQAPLFDPAVEVGTVTNRGSVDITDWDGDGRQDIIAGASNGKVLVFLNSGKKGAATFAEGIDPKLPPLKQPRVLMVDLNGDGDQDLFVPSLQGSAWIERSFLRHGYAPATYAHVTRAASPRK